MARATVEDQAAGLNREPEPGQSRPIPRQSGPIIEVQGASKQFGKGKQIVRDLNFKVEQGQIFCLLGPSGSGKSTTMRLLTGLYRPSEGRVLVFGQEPHSFKKTWRQKMGYMPQQFVLFPELSTQGNVNFVASVYGMSWFGRRKKIKRALEFVDLWEARDRLASQLSGGMQRRLELAATLIHNPQLIFVDEPTAGIDPILRAKFWEHFHDLRDQGRTIFVTTQYVTEADYCDVVAILNRGRVLALGAPEDIRREAFGGEIINLTLESLSAQAVKVLRSLPPVRKVKLMPTEELKLTVDNSGEALPLILAALQEANINVQSIEPYRPDFEEVFVTLMESDQEDEDEVEPDDEREKTDRQRRVAQKPAAVSPSLPGQAARPEAHPVSTTGLNRTESVSPRFEADGPSVAALAPVEVSAPAPTVRAEMPSPTPEPSPGPARPNPDPTMPPDPTPLTVPAPPASPDPGPIQPDGPDSRLRPVAQQSDSAAFGPPASPPQPRLQGRPTDKLSESPETASEIVHNHNLEPKREAQG